MTPQNKAKLQSLLKLLTPDKTAVDFSEFDQGIADFKNAVKEKIQVQTVDDVNRKLKDFLQRFDLSKLEAIAEDVKMQVISKIEELTDAVEQEKQALMLATQSGLDETGRTVDQIRADLDILGIDLKALQSSKAIDLVNDEITQLKIMGGSYTQELAKLAQGLDELNPIIDQKELGLRSEIIQLDGALKSTKLDLTNRINNIHRGGGNANRNISIGGNASTLSRYTDINLKAGNNVTITYTNNDTTKNTDITISSSGGGGGSVTGIIRSINTVSTSQVMGNTAGTDYVYLATAGINLTLPAALGNTNLYTVKNISNSSVLVSGTIDDDPAGVIMPVKYTSVDLISNDTDFKIT